MDFLMLGADSVAGVDLTGEEMLEWTDMPSREARKSSVLAYAVGKLLAPGGRLLLAGAHDAEFIRGLADAGASIDLLLRGLADAQAARIEHADIPVKVHCGSLNTFSETGYDAVVALGGVAVLATPEQALSWPDAIAALRRAVRPGGTMVVAVPNTFGLDRVVDPRHGVRDTNDDWPSGAPERTADGLADVLGTLDLANVRTFALFPDLDAPTAVIERGLLAGGPDARGLATVVAATWTFQQDRPAVTDPRRLARDAIRAGLGCELAPAWLFVGEAGSQQPAEAQLAGPVAFVDLPLLEPDLTVVQSLQPEVTGGWRREPLGARLPRVAGRLTRSPDLLQGTVAAGESLEELLIDACGRHDLATVRALLIRYAQWLDESGLPPSGLPFASLDNVVDTGLGLHLIDPSWSYAGQVTAPVAATKAMLRFARRLQSGAYEHPWPVGATQERLAVTLATTAGLTVSEQDVRAAVELDAELGEVFGDTLGEVFGDTGDTDPAHGWTIPRGHREALATVARLNAALADAQAQVAWLDQTVADRDRRLAEAAKVRKSITFRIGRVFTFPVSVLVRALRR
jgi:SAM-dependent methyltransferase